jgi:hypothetical protein
MTRLSPWLRSGALLVGVLAWGCSSSAATDPVQIANADADTDSLSSLDGDATADNLSGASCMGSAILPGFAAYDSDCDFLAACPKQGKCFCGASCTSEDTLCDPSLCAEVSTTCWCGEACAAQGKKLCPQYVCDKDVETMGCIAQEQCTFVDKDPPSWCGCVKMPDRDPDCWCGTCDPPKPACAADKCVGKNPEKCIVVPGALHADPYCESCGLLTQCVGATCKTLPKCFFVVVPGQTP